MPILTAPPRTSKTVISTSSSQLMVDRRDCCGTIPAVLVIPFRYGWWVTVAVATVMPSGPWSRLKLLVESNGRNCGLVEAISVKAS